MTRTLDVPVPDWATPVARWTDYRINPDGTYRPGPATRSGIVKCEDRYSNAYVHGRNDSDPRPRWWKPDHARYLTKVERDRLGLHGPPIGRRIGHGFVTFAVGTTWEEVQRYLTRVERATRDARNPDSGKHPHARKHGWAIGNTRKPSKALQKALDSGEVRRGAPSPLPAAASHRKKGSATIRQNTNPTSPGKDADTMSDAPDTAPDSEGLATKLENLPTNDLLRLRSQVDRLLDVRRMALQAQLDELTAAMQDADVSVKAAEKPSDGDRSVTKGRVPARPKKRANRRTGGAKKVWTDERVARFVKVYTEEGSKAAAEKFGMKRQSAAQKMSALRKEGKAPKVGA